MSSTSQEQKQGAVDDNRNKKCVLAEQRSKVHVSQGYRRKKALEKQWMSTHDFMRWYDPLKAFTFPSASIEITVNEAKALVRMYHHRVNGSHALSTEHSASITALQHKIDSTITERMHTIMHSTHNGYFVRLSSRSPKDATMFEPYLSRTKQSMYDILQQKICSGAPNDYNTQAIAFFQACLEQMRVYTADDVIALLCNSERVLTDLNTWIIGGDEDHTFDMTLIIREWNDIVVGSEYRAFIGPNGNLNAVCQYYNFLYFPLVAKHKQDIQQLLSTFYDEHLQEVLLAHRSLLPCVIDFAIVDQNENADWPSKKVVVVELNMFHDYNGAVQISSGSEMFDWHKDEQILLHGPLEFRVNEELVEFSFFKKFVNPDWLQIIEDVVGRLEQEQKRKYIIYAVVAVLVAIIAIVCAVVFT